MELGWNISTFSRQGNSCVEIGFERDREVLVGVHIRHSKDPNGQELIFNPEEWRAFIAGVKSGEFDE